MCSGVIPSKAEALGLSVVGINSFTNSIWPICLPKVVKERSFHLHRGYNLVGFGRDISSNRVGEVLTQESLTVQVSLLDLLRSIKDL